MISIFARPNRLGSEIRGRQIAEYLGAKYNPTEFENDLCIHVKPRNFDKVKDGDWVDVSDGNKIPKRLKIRPKVKAIFHTQYLYEHFKDLPNEKIWISQQHLNWEEAKRDRIEITTCGYIGGISSVAKKMYSEIGARLKEIGFDFITCFNYKTRQDAVDFYKKIDILVIGLWPDNIYKTPTKIINAASFGIPAIAQRYVGYKEIEGNYVPIKSIDDIVKEATKFKDKIYYKEWSDRIIKMAEKYHIKKVAKRYEAICNHTQL